MPSFANPFYGNVSKKMSLSELIRALRLDVAAEEEAAGLYEAHADATDNPIARKVLLDVANEERVHVGEFIELINILTQYEEKAWIENGALEVREMADEVARGDLELDTPAEKRAEEGLNGNGAEPSSSEDDNAPTIGSMKE